MAKAPYADRAGAADVELRGVFKRFGARAASGLYLPLLRFPGQRLTSLLGPSGCGKTTVLRVLAGLESVDSGQVLVGEVDITHVPASERDVCQVSQSYALFPHLSVLDNVTFGPLAQKVPKTDAEARARGVLASLDLVGIDDRLPGELSGGQQQRVAIARALVVRPRILLFDEPLSNLDAGLRRHVREDIRALQQRLGLTVVYVTHDAAEALAVSDHVVVLNNGRVMQQGTPREIYERPSDAFVANFVDDTTLFDVLVDDTGHVHLGPLQLPLASTVARSGRARVAIRPDAWELLPPSQGGLAATVVHAAYLGAAQELRMQTDVGTFTVRCPMARHLYHPGAPVCLRLRPGGGAALLPQD